MVVAIHTAAWLLFATICGAAPAALTPDYEIIYNLLPTMAPENIFLRSNGQLLVTCLNCNTISQLDPTLGPTQVRRTVFEIPDGDVNVLGIDELQHDVFAVAVGEVNVATGKVLGPSGVWIIDLRKYQAPDYNSSKVRAYPVESESLAGVFDGLAVINVNKGLVATTDVAEGKIWLIDTINNKTTVLADSPILGPGPGTNLSSIELTNGLKYKDSKLYFTGTVTGTYGYLPVHQSTGAATGPVKVIYNYGFALDDFAFGPKDNVYLTTFARPNGGILRRAVGTPVGQSGTHMIVSKFGTNSVVPRTTADGNCELIFSAVLTFQIARATISGPC